MLLHLRSFKTLFTPILAALLLGACAGGGKVKNSTAEDAAQRQASEALIRMETEFTAGKNAYNEGDLNKAEAVFFAMSRAYPEFSAPYANLAMVYAQKGEVEKAEEAFVQALSLKSDIPELYNHLGIMYRKEGEFAKAMLKYQEGLEIAPDHPNLLANLGILYDLYLNKPQEALKYYQRHQELVPGDKQMEVWIGDLMQRAMTQ